MDEVREEQVRAARDKFKELWPEVSPSMRIMRAVLEAAALAAPQEAGGVRAEPVALIDGDGNISVPEGSPLSDLLKAMPPAPVGKPLFPLYAAPVSAPSPSVAPAGVTEAMKEH